MHLLAEHRSVLFHRDVTGPDSSCSRPPAAQVAHAGTMALLNSLVNEMRLAGGFSEAYSNLG